MCIRDRDIRKKKEALIEMEKKLKSLDETEEKEINSLNVLKVLEENLKKQLAEWVCDRMNRYKSSYSLNITLDSILVLLLLEFSSSLGFSFWGSFLFLLLSQSDPFMDLIDLVLTS